MAQGNARGGEISDVAYDAGTWDGVINEAASKNAIRDKFVTVDSAVSSNTSHAAGDGSDHSDVAANTAASHAELHNAASHSDQTATGAEVDAAHAHVSADGSSHSDVVDNTNAISALTSSYSRRKAVIDYIINNTLAPPSETDGNRFILAFDGGAPHANWDGASAGDIVEFVTDTWVATTPLEGYIAYVDDDDKDALCIDDGGASWELRNVNTLLHEDLTDVSSDQHHAESHNAASHSDIDSTGAQLDGAVTHAGTTTGNPHNLDSTDVGAEASGAVSTHAALTTGVHGAGGDTLATDADITTHAGDADAHHAESHTIASHDTTATGAELTELTDSSETTLHSHAASSGTMIYDKLIAPSGGDYTSVVTALSTEGKGVAFGIAPGTYTESAAATLKEGQTLQGLGGAVGIDAESPVIIDMGDYQFNIGESAGTSGCILRGIKFKFTPASNHRVMYVQNNDNVVVEDIYIEVLGTQQSQGLEIYGCLDGRFRNITIKGNSYTYWALYVNTSSYSFFENIKISYTRNQTGYADSMYVSASHWNTFQNITMDNFQATSWSTANSNAITDLGTNTFNIYRDIFISGGDKIDDGVSLSGKDSLLSGARIQGCINGVHIIGGTDSSQKIENFWIYNCDYSGIWPQQNTGSDIFIANGRIETCGDGVQPYRGGITNQGSYSGNKIRIINVQVQSTPANNNDLYLYNAENMLTNVSCDGDVYLVGDDNVFCNCWIDGTLELNAISERTTLVATHYGTLTDAGSFLTEVTKVHRSTSAPTVNDDIADGFKAGDYWLKTDTAVLYVCIDNAAGAADWDALSTFTATAHDSRDHSTVMSTVVASDISDISSSGANIDAAVSASHAESHTITSHSDVTDATGAQLETLTGGGETSLHTHPAAPPAAHALNSHTSCTKAQLVADLSDVTNLISTLAGEFAGFASASLASTDRVLIEDQSASYAKKYAYISSFLTHMRTYMGLYECEVGTYVGNNVNSRTIPTGVDFDFALVMCGEGRTNTQDHGVFGLYVAGFIQWSYNNGSANCMRNESGPGTSDRFGGKSGENILLGSTGNNVMNSNYTGWDYAWIAIDFS